jgi:hypothetical protein
MIIRFTKTLKRVLIQECFPAVCSEYFYFPYPILKSQAENVQQFCIILPVDLYAYEILSLTWVEELVKRLRINTEKHIET